MKDLKVLGANKKASAATEPEKSKDAVRTDLRKREHKALMKNLTLAQMSTGSMGKFDKKAGKNEPAAPKSQKVEKKKSNKSLAGMEHNRGQEKERNMKIFDRLQKKGEIAVAGHGKSLSNAHVDDGKITKKAARKDDGFRKRVGAGKTGVKRGGKR